MTTGAHVAPYGSSQMPDGTGRSVVGLEDLPRRWGADPFVVGDFHRWRAHVVWGDDVALLVAVRTADDKHALVGVGEPADLAAVVTAVVRAGAHRPDGSSVLDDGGPVSASLTRGTWDLCAGDVRQLLDLPAGTDWDWLLTEDLPPHQEGEELVSEVDLAADAEEIRELHAIALPATFFPVDRPGARWFGRRDDDGALVAVAGAAGWEHTVQVGGVATSPSWRGRGLGSAVTAAATRAGVVATGRVSLSLYADNVAAYRTYRRLGFRLGQPVETRRPG